MSRNRPEQKLQCAVAAYLRWTMPADVFWTAVPAGGGGKIRGAIMKAMGYRAGTPDLLFVHKGRARWIELKSDIGRMSEAQQQTCISLVDAGCPNVVVCKSLDEVISTLRIWEIPMRLNARAA